MDILMVSAELAPFVRASEAADNVAALAKALRQLGHNVTVAMPRYPGFEASGLLLARRLTPLPLGPESELTVFDGQLPSGVALVLFDAPGLFDRPGVYGEGEQEYPDNEQRFELLSRAAVALAAQRAEQGKPFNVMHLHDWPAALVPLFSWGEGALPTVLTVHDVRRQGVFNPEVLSRLSLARDAELRLGDRLNVLKAGLELADAVTTVSSRYADDLKKPEVSGQLASVVERLHDRILGITHGVDYSIYNPATDSALEARYDAEDASGKYRSKVAMLRKLELELEVDRPLVVAIGELSTAGAADVLFDALPMIMKNDLAFVVAGSGEAELMRRFAEQRAEYAEDFAFVQNPDANELRRLYAAADFVIVLSRNEPCATRQLYAQRYGALPIAYAIGGVCDTVVDADAEYETGTGFLFDELSAEALGATVTRALSAFTSPAWPRLRRRVMRLDVAWDRPARRYAQVYRQITQKS
jgi:starch synthase